MGDWKNEYRRALLDLTSHPPDYRKIVNSNIPKKLYKYGSFESKYWEEVVFEGKIYLSKASSFNDPFDCRANISLRALKKGKFRDALVNRFGNGVDKITREQMDGIVEDLRGDIYVFCFSELYNSILMWSHYAKNNTGFCVEYDTSLIKDYIKQNLVPVLYENKYIDITNSIISSNKNSGIICSIVKARDWEYEKEWRLIEYEANHKYLKKQISAIYLGINCDTKNQERVVSWGNENKVKILKMKRSDSKYELLSAKI